MVKELIEKAHQVGDPHPKGKNLVWTEYKPGKFDWRPPKKGAAKTTSGSSADAEPKNTSSQPKQNTQTEDGNGVSSTTPAKKTSGGYTPKKAKTAYKSGSKHHVEVPETWKIKKPNGRVVDVQRESIIKMLEGKTDDEIVKWVNDPKRAWKYRQLGWDEAASRGIDESKLNPSGTLQDEWDRIEELAQATGKSGDEEEGEEEDYDMNLMGFNIEEFMSQFENGDEGWKDENDKRVQKAFNKLDTLVDRQKYDAFLDYQKRQDENYSTPKEEVQDLNAEYLTFLTTNISPLFISAGGAGVGKTFGLKKIAAAMNYKFMTEDQNPSDGDWTIVKCANPKSDKEFFEMLKKYNGSDDQGNPHVLVFDDHDSILTNKQYTATMKTIADTDPDSRLFKDPETGKMIKFTGKVLVITNKNQNALMKAAGDAAEDLNAVFSRAAKKDIHFTINENLEILKNRYKTMQIDGLQLSPQQEQKAREEVYRFIVANKGKLHPQFFTVRKFGEVMKQVQKDFATQAAVQNDPTLADVIGTGKGWKKMALNVLNKAEENDIEKAESSFSKKIKNLPKETQEAMAKIKKNHPEIYSQLWGDEALDILNRDDSVEEENPKKKVKGKKNKTEEDVEKSFFDGMNIDEAENLIFG